MALRDDLIRVATTRLLDPLSVLLQSDPVVAPLVRRVRIEAEAWAAQLLGPDDTLARQLGIRLVAVFHPADAAFDPAPEWWQTPFGRAIARRVGHPGAEHVSYAVAGAMLGITRQGVHDLVKRHKLRRHPDGGVATDSIHARLSRLDHAGGAYERTT